jgi:hypothetical protein
MNSSAASLPLLADSQVSTLTGLFFADRQIASCQLAIWLKTIRSLFLKGAHILHI